LCLRQTNRNIITRQMIKNWFHISWATSFGSNFRSVLRWRIGISQCQGWRKILLSSDHMKDILWLTKSIARTCLGRQKVMKIVDWTVIKDANRILVGGPRVSTRRLRLGLFSVENRLLDMANAGVSDACIPESFVWSSIGLSNHRLKVLPAPENIFKIQQRWYLTDCRFEKQSVEKTISCRKEWYRKLMDQ